ncbi:Hypothetical predicted protein [Xyrichtys novacula]|uniref:Uncharacterized protein n=1 Tax=Xyrichtys novacula TaxID=13765 RepID=A0AAV1GLW2_XYRNO|nr:Hypothetical predicted protein [Xyrichtys novacula]
MMGNQSNRQPEPQATRTTGNQSNGQPEQRATRTTGNQNHRQPEPQATRTTGNQSNGQPEPQATRTTGNQNHRHSEPEATRATGNQSFCRFVSSPRRGENAEHQQPDRAQNQDQIPDSGTRTARSRDGMSAAAGTERGTSR